MLLQRQMFHSNIAQNIFISIKVGHQKKEEENQSICLLPNRGHCGPVTRSFTFTVTLDSHLYIHFHGFRVEGNMNKLHPEVMRRFVKGCVDADRCNTERSRGVREHLKSAQC